MTIHISTNFHNTFENDESLTIIFIHSSHKNTCKTKIKKITTNELYISPNDSSLEELPFDQIFSAIYVSEQGLYGFHSRRIPNRLKDTDNLICINKPQKGWKIQRRKHPRLPFIQKGFVKKAFLSFLSKKAPSLLINISQEGMCFQSNKKLSRKNLIKLYFEIEKTKINQLSSIIWRAKIPIPQRLYNFKYSYGAKFINPDKNLQTLIQILENKK
jgi:c-di-GMP-binding flagellar brake protein YcgR